jgi:hypothetical protein
MTRKLKRIPPPYVEKIAEMTTTASPCPQNKIAAKWAQKLTNHWTGQAERGFAAGAVLFDLGGNGAF